MGIKKYKPTSPGKRFRTVMDFAEITATEPLKSLVRPLNKTGGRNNLGRVTIWQRGGGNSRKYRLIDFKRDKTGVPAVVASIVIRTDVPYRSAEL
jgi:large subunit ribosomal protein L2